MAPTTASNGTPLQCAFCFSFMRRGKSGAKGAAAAAAGEEGKEGGAAATSPPQPQEQQEQTEGGATAGGIVHPYENSIKIITSVKTVEEFWEAYNHLRRPNDLPTTTDYHFFRDGIKPTWEDPSNARGGKWIVRLPKGLASRYWEEVILALVGGQFPGIPDGEICGLVVSIRYSEDILGVWNRNATTEVVERLRDAIKRVLQLPPHAPMEYKPHQTSIQDKSSFRNTQVWKPKSLLNRQDSAGSAPMDASTGMSGGPGGSSGIPGIPPSSRENRRSGSWGEREKPKGRDTDRAWR